jgi:hypothetical protein
MTDSHDPLDPNPSDALASAHLDGRTTDAEAARIAADPELGALVAAMAGVREAIRAPVGAVDETHRTRAIDAALAAFDADAAEPAREGTKGPAVTSLTAFAARRGTSRRRLQLVGVAAAAALVALAVPLVSSLGSDRSDDDVATSALEESTAGPDQREAYSDDAAGGSGDVGAPSSPMAAGGAAPLVDLGAFDDLAGLVAAVRPIVGTTAPAEPAPTTTIAADGQITEGATAGPEADCAAPTDGASPVLSARATLGGRAVLVSVLDGGTGERLLLVHDAADCSLVVSTSL